MTVFFKKHKEALMLALRCTIAFTLFICAVINYHKLTHIDMRALVEGAGSTAIAVLLIIGIYTVKSVLFIIPASMIYIYVGMAFSPLSAIAVNFLGIFVEVTITYWLGRFLGGSYVEKRLKGKKGAEKILALGNKKGMWALFTVRVLPVFPIDFVSLFLGSTKLNFFKYMLVSLGGILPRVALFTILGDKIYDYIPMDLIMGIVILCIPILIIYWIIKYIKKKKSAEQTN